MNRGQQVDPLIKDEKRPALAGGKHFFVASGEKR
jgi:hypothetical protein